MLINRELAIASNAKSKRTGRVSVPELGGEGAEILIRALSVKEMERYWEILDDAKNGVYAPAGKRGSVVMMGCENDDGTPFWKEEDAAWLGDEADEEAINRIYNGILELSGMTARQQKELAKKPETPTDSSLNGSPTGTANGTSNDSSES